MTLFSFGGMRFDDFFGDDGDIVNVDVEVDFFGILIFVGGYFALNKPPEVAEVFGTDFGRFTR